MWAQPPGWNPPPPRQRDFSSTSWLSVCFPFPTLAKTLPPLYRTGGEENILGISTAPSCSCQIINPYQSAYGRVFIFRVTSWENNWKENQLADLTLATVISSFFFRNVPFFTAILSETMEEKNARFDNPNYTNYESRNNVLLKWASTWHNNPRRSKKLIHTNM